MRKKIISTLCLSGCAAAALLFFKPAEAAKQKYTRHYQKKEAFFQKKDPYFQKKDLPNAAAYLEVSRKMPQVSVKYQSQETAFKSDQSEIVCQERNTLSCTRFAVAFSAAANCDDSRIVLTVTETQKMTAELSSLYEKGSCPFDLILKHELQHVDAYKRTLNNFIKQTEQNLITTYTIGQRESKGCKEIQQRIADLTAGLSQRYAEAAREENALLDQENGAHAYGLETCAAQQKNGASDPDNQ